MKDLIEAIQRRLDEIADVISSDNAEREKLAARDAELQARIEHGEKETLLLRRAAAVLTGNESAEFGVPMNARESRDLERKLSGERVRYEGGFGG